MNPLCLPASFLVSVSLMYYMTASLLNHQEFITLKII